MAAVNIYSQELIIEGSQLVVKSGANVLLAANSNWTNNATAVCDAGSWVRFTATSGKAYWGQVTQPFQMLTSTTAMATEFGWKETLQ